MPQVDVKQLDITKTNIAVQQLIEVTENPRHRYLLQAYERHRNLEHAGRFEEIFAPEMTVEHPVYRFNMAGQPPMQLEGRDQVEPLYRLLGRDRPVHLLHRGRDGRGRRLHGGRARMIGYQQTLGSALAAAGVEDVEEDAMYLAEGASR